MSSSNSWAGRARDLATRAFPVTRAGKLVVKRAIAQALLETAEAKRELRAWLGEDSAIAGHGSPCPTALHESS